MLGSGDLFTSISSNWNNLPSVCLCLLAKCSNTSHRVELPEFGHPGSDFFQINDSPAKNNTGTYHNNSSCSCVSCRADLLAGCLVCKWRRCWVYKFVHCACHHSSAGSIADPGRAACFCLTWGDLFLLMQEPGVHHPVAELRRANGHSL